MFGNTLLKVKDARDVIIMEEDVALFKTLVVKVIVMEQVMEGKMMAKEDVGGDLVCGSNNCKTFGIYYHEKDDCGERLSFGGTGINVQ